MRLVGTVISAMIAGILIFGTFPVLWQSYGVLGGWMGCVLVVGVAWFLCHRLELIHNPPGAAWVDMAVGIGTAGIVWLKVLEGASILNSMPTLLCLMAGGALGAVAAEAVKKSNTNWCAKPRTSELAGDEIGDPEPVRQASAR